MHSKVPPAALLVLYTTLLISPSRAATPRTIVASVERVSDGDTVVAHASNGTKLRVSLLGVKAPEVLHSENPGQSLREEGAK
jgi:endonuclease YncB( thermonuclease family)